MILKTFWLKVLAVVVPLAMITAVACTPSQAQTLEGILQNVDSANGHITILTKDGKTVELTIDTKAPISTEGKASNVDSLAPGAQVKVEVKGDGKVAEKVEARQSEIVGSISAISGNDVTIQPESGAAVTVHVSDSTKIKLSEDVAGKLSDLKVGQKVEVKFDPATNVALRIHPVGAEDEKEEAGQSVVKGAIQSMSGNTVIVKDKDGKLVSVTVNDQTKIQLAEGKAGALKDLVAGMEVNARYDPATGIASRILLLPAESEEGPAHQGEMKGAIQSVSGSTVVIKDEKGKSVSVTVNDQTKIQLAGGKAGALKDLVAGMEVNARYDPATGVASMVLVLPAAAGKATASMGEMKGAIQSISGNTLIVKDKDGKTVTLTVNDQTKIQLAQGKAGALKDLTVGMEVIAKYDPGTGVASRILLGESGA